MEVKRHDGPGNVKERYDTIEEVKAVRGMGPGFSYHHVLCKVRLVGPWIKRRKVLNGARRIRGKKVKEHQYREIYAMFENKRVEWDKESNVEHLWEEVEHGMVESACSVRIGGGEEYEVN